MAGNGHTSMAGDDICDKQPCRCHHPIALSRRLSMPVELFLANRTYNMHTKAELFLEFKGAISCWTVNVVSNSEAATCLARNGPPRPPGPAHRLHHHHAQMVEEPKRHSSDTRQARGAPPKAQFPPGVSKVSRAVGCRIRSAVYLESIDRAFRECVRTGDRRRDKQVSPPTTSSDTLFSALTLDLATATQADGLG